VVVVAASPLVPRQWRRRRRRRLCFGDELAAWPCKEIDILAKSIHSTTANCFSSRQGGFDALPRFKSDNGNGSVAVWRVSPSDRPFDHRRTGLGESCANPSRSEPRDCLQAKNVRRTSAGRATSCFGSFAMPVRRPSDLGTGAAPSRTEHELAQRHPVHPSTRPLDTLIAGLRCRNVLRMPQCPSIFVTLRYVGGRRPFFECF